MPASRAVLVLGMHRSGTSAIARGLQTLSVYLGDDFLDAQPENPTGYWEDKGVVAIDERLLRLLGLAWDDVAPIDRRQFERWRVRRLRRAAIAYVQRTFASQPLWGFKDPRTIRVLPFWRGVLEACAADDTYVVVIRNPRSVAASLFARQGMEATQAYRLWLAYMVPFLRDLRGKPWVVVDYDLFMGDPRGEVERIADALHISDRASPRESGLFVSGFLDAKLRHTIFEPNDLPTDSAAARQAKEVYLALRKVAAIRSPPEAAFWSEWEAVDGRLEGASPCRNAAQKNQKGN